MNYKNEYILKTENELNLPYEWKGNDSSVVSLIYLLLHKLVYHDFSSV